MNEWWVSTIAMTFWVQTTLSGAIIDAAPIAQRFVGQPFVHLERWLQWQGGYRKELLG